MGRTSDCYDKAVVETSLASLRCECLCSGEASELTVAAGPSVVERCSCVWEPPARFVDEQAAGMFIYWQHERRFEACPEGVLMTDRVEYEVPLGWVGVIARHLFVERVLRRVFDYRAAKIGTALLAHRT